MVVVCLLVAVSACVGDDPATAPSGAVDAGDASPSSPADSSSGNPADAMPTDASPSNPADASPDADAALACTSSCTTEGATQCASGKAQTCTKGSDGCLSWSTPADCPANQVCCATACAPVDTTNCYACNASCSGSTPRCLSGPKKCGCSVATCAVVSQGCSATTGSCETCTALPGGAADIYVDATSFAGGTGTEGCPFKTITAAITKADAGTATSVTIHVAAGVYNAALGESFPFVLRSKSISIVGAGADKTTIQGTGTVNHASDGGQLNGTYQVTVLVGDETARYTLSGLSLRAASDVPAGGYLGVYCDRGNAPLVVASPPPSPFPAPSLLLEDLTVGPGYERAVIGSNSTLPVQRTGCNLMVTGSTFTGNLGGIWSLGGGLTADPATTTALRVGTKSVGTGNVFKNIKQPSNNGPAIEVWDGVSPVLLFNNSVEDSNIGFALVNHARADPGIPVPPYFEIEGNTITGVTNYGIGIFQSMVVEKLTDNTITGATAPATAGYPAIGLLFDPGNASGDYLAVVKRARGNKIIGNEVGIEWRGKPFKAQPDNLVSDFGTAMSPGMNTIACNSTAVGMGYDLHVRVAALGGGEPTFAGNLWDHVPPVTKAAAAGVNGDDVLYTATVSTPAFDVTGATRYPTACPAGRVP